MSARTDREVMDRVHEIVGHRCRDELCKLGTEDCGPEFTVIFDAETAWAIYPCVAYAMCNDCVTDVRREMPDDLREIKTNRRASRAVAGR